MKPGRLFLQSAPTILYVIRCITAFSTTFPLLTQCEPATITWNGPDAQPPFELTVLPINSTRPRLIQIPNTAATWNSSSQTGSYTLDVLDLSAGTPYLLSMANSTDLGVGGVSNVQRVASSSNTNCLPSDNPEKLKVFNISTTPSQCMKWIIRWDSSDVKATVRVWGFVPGGTAFILDEPPAGQNSQQWTVNAEKGTPFVLLFHTPARPINSDTLVETSELLTVDGNEVSPTSCLTLTSRPRITGPNDFPSDKTDHNDSFPRSKSKVGAIVGGVIGGIVGVLLVIGLVVFVGYRRIDRSPPASDGQKVPNGSPDIQPQSPSFYNTRNVADEPVSQMQ